MSCRKERNGMVEITGTELVALEQHAHNGNLTKKDVRKIFALIVQQQALIEKQAAEIAVKDRMLELACNRLAMLSANDEHGYGNETWFAWLEKEAQGVE